MIITGCEDGYIRSVTLYPHNIKTIGCHCEDENEPEGIQKVAISRCSKIAASISLDMAVYFWDLSEINSNDNQINEEQYYNQNQNKTIINKNKKDLKNENFFEDL